MGVSVEQPSDRLLTVLMADASTTVSYVGEAAAGSSTSASVWRIKRLDTTSGLELKFADGNTFFDNVWDDRTLLSYL